MANAPPRQSAALIITGLAKAAPGSVRQIVLNAMVHLQHSHATAGILAAGRVRVSAEHQSLDASKPIPHDMSAACEQETWCLNEKSNFALGVR
jgi:hypothetical protein